jgi:hypothetical protein
MKSDKAHSSIYFPCGFQPRESLPIPGQGQLRAGSGGAFRHFGIRDSLTLSTFHKHRSTLTAILASRPGPNQRTIWDRCCGSEMRSVWQEGGWVLLSSSEAVALSDMAEMPLNM